MRAIQRAMIVCLASVALGGCEGEPETDADADAGADADADTDADTDADADADADAVLDADADGGGGGDADDDGEGAGLAADYPGDIGIERDPDVIFVESFEEPLAETLARWEYGTNTDRMRSSADVPPGSSGSQSALFEGSADLYQRLLPGHDRLFVRFYAKLDAACRNVHHWVWLGGHNPSTGWPWPRAGERPVGDERWSTGIEPWGPSWAWDFFTYWMHMRGNPADSRFWGNAFSGRPSPFAAVRDEWVCVELMVTMNDPVESWNGEQAFWIDGVLRNHLGPGFPSGEWVWDAFHPDPTGGGEPFEGFQWRTDPALNINYLWLEHYVDSDPACRCWFDDLVVATRYIGPIVPR